jgi:hypothetical protein
MSQPDQTGPPTWYNEPPEWVKQLNQRRDPAQPPVRTGSYEAGRQDQELLTAVHALPEQVVHALRSAIEAATPKQTAPPPPPEQQQQQQQQTQEPPKTNDNPPNHGETFADKWFGNKLFS